MLDVEGEAWRTVPDEVVLRVGLAAGRRLDRPLLRELRRELRRAEALGAAERTLARRDVSEATLRERLRRAGVAPAPAAAAAEALKRFGALDDWRFAAARARNLAERGWGDEAIAVRLEGEGAPPAAVKAAVAGLPPEPDRAARIVEGLPARKAAALLARRGFDPDTIEAAVPTLDAEG